jgi:hypothetical protein
MVLTLQRLKYHWARTRDGAFVDRIATAEIALQERLRPCVDEDENGKNFENLNFEILKF